jgi:YegS/Rv2252/BmrU family lipid kinase
MRDMRALVIRNDRSRAGRLDLSSAYGELASRGVAVTELFPETPDQLRAAIRDRAPVFDVVAIGGGDGSLNAALPALVEIDRAFAVIPLGTANDFARSLGLPSDPIEACQVIADGKPRDVFLGEVEGRLYLNVAGIGLGPEVTRRVTDLKPRWGMLAYSRAIVDAWKKVRAFQAVAVIDGRPARLHAIQISVANGSRYGGIATVDPAASPDSPELILHVVEPMPLWRLVRQALAVVRGRVRDKPGHRLCAARSIEIRTGRPMPITADGEILAHTPARFRVGPHRLRVIAPADDRRGTDRAEDEWDPVVTLDPSAAISLH